MSFLFNKKNHEKPGINWEETHSAVLTVSPKILQSSKHILNKPDATGLIGNISKLIRLRQLYPKII
jgi:hypothetical protein